MSGMRVTSGRPSGLLEAIAARVAELRRAGALEPINILVAASLQRPFIDRWLATRLGATASVRILMPGDLGLLLGAPTLVAQGRRALPPLADRILLAEVARQQQGYFAPVAATPGFADALYRLVRELRGASLDLSNLEPILEGATDAAEKAGSLAGILAGFEGRRTRFYAADDALAAADPTRLRGLGLLVWGFLSLSPVLEKLLVAIAEQMPVDVMLPDVPAAADAPLAELIRRLTSFGADFYTAAPATPEPATTLARVRGRLFTPPASPAILPDGTIRLVSAPDPSREVRAATRACLGWADEGVPFWEMAVAYRDGDTYRPLVEAVFLEAGIPVYLHEGSPLAQRPVGRQTIALLDLYDSDLSRQSVMDFLTDARLPRELRDEFGGVPATAWDGLSRQAGIVGGRDQWRDRLEGLQHDLRGRAEEGELPDWVQRRIDDAGALSRFVLDLDDRLRAHAERATWADHLAHLDALISRYVVGGDLVVRALRGLERFSALEHEVDFTWFLEVVRRAIETLRSEDVLEGRPGAFARRGVNVMAVNSLSGIEMRRAWILGAAEGSFPPAPGQDPILLDTEREVISARGPYVLPLRRTRGEEEPLQFALACEAARERLVVSYARRATGESRPQLPSIFFREIASQLEGRRVSAEEAPLLARDDVERILGDAIASPIPGGRRATDERVVHEAANLAISAPDRDRTLLQADVTRPVAIATFAHPGSAFARAIAADHARQSGLYSEWDGALTEQAREAIARRVPPERPFSPSALEDYARCPQLYLMRYVLRVRDVVEPERIVQLDALNRGSLVHRILERFEGEWQRPGPAAVDSNAAGRMRAIAEEECRRAEAHGETGYPALWGADRAELIDDCLEWLEKEQQDPMTFRLPNVACEVRFGPPRPGEVTDGLSRDDPIEIPVGGRTLRLSGRMDRLNWDQARTAYRVIDYKTGQVRDEKAGQLQGGRMLQLPLYVLAAAQLLDVDPTGGVAAYAYSTRRGDFRIVAWSGADLAGRRADLDAALAAIVDGVAAGDFFVAPHDASSACTWCDFDGVCPHPRAAYVKRKADDPRLGRLNELRKLP